MLENSINHMIDSMLLMAKSIEKDIDAAKTHLNDHVTIEEEILTLEKSCEYCQITLENRKELRDKIILFIQYQSYFTSMA